MTKERQRQAKVLWVVSCLLLLFLHLERIEGFTLPSTLSTHGSCLAATRNENRSTLNSGSTSKSTSPKNTSNRQLYQLEKQVRATSQAKLDYDSIVQALDKAATDDERERNLNSLVGLPNDALLVPPWKIALASSTVVACSTFYLFSSLTITITLSTTVFFIALMDPTQDETLWGPVARMLGRATLQSYQASQPKVRALARAVLTGEAELQTLQERVRQLEEEKEELLMYKRRRDYVDAKMGSYSLEELKDVARRKGIKMGGTKSQLMMRLLEADAIPIDYMQWQHCMDTEDGFPV